MRRAAWPAVGMLVVAGVATAAAQAPVVPAVPYYAMPPAGPSAASANPVQQQIIENYRTRLLQTRRDLLQQNPSGLSPDQLAVERQLNAVTPAGVPPSGTAAGPGPRFNPAPFGPSAAVPAPPFNAAPRP